MIKKYTEWLNEAAAKPGLTPEQVEWCNKYIEGEWSLNSRGEVEVAKNLSIKPNIFLKSSRDFTRFPVQFADVKGYFNCQGCTGLTSLEGAPQKVGDVFDCRDCTGLTSLEGAPQKVEGGFYCRRCTSLTTLEGAPQEVGDDFSCGGCTGLTTLKGAPQEVRGDFYYNDCPKIPQEEINFLKNSPDLFWDWMKSGLSFGEYQQKYKGKITGKKFGL